MDYSRRYNETSEFQEVTFHSPFGNFTSPTTPVTTPRRKVSAEIYPWVWIYVAPVIFFLGVIGNLLTILVMRRKRLRRSTTAVYLIVLAIADTLALVTRIPAEFFENLSIVTFKDINRWTCRFEKFTFYTFSDIAIWILVLFTIDRFIAVCLPFYKAKVCRPKRALTACGVTSLLLVGKNLHVFWTRGEERDSFGEIKSRCGRSAYVFEHFIRPWIAFTTISLVPFIIIVSCNTSIVVHLIKARHKVVFHQKEPPPKAETSSFSIRTSNSATTSTYSMSGIIPWIRRIQGPSRVFTQTTLMCLSTSVAFLVCVSPSIILTLGRIKWSNDPRSVYAFSVAQAVNYQLSCLNHAINFFLYCLSGQRFREELIDLFCGNKTSHAHSTRRRMVEKHKNSLSNSASDSNRPETMKGSSDMLCTIDELPQKHDSSHQEVTL